MGEVSHPRPYANVADSFARWYARPPAWARSVARVVRWSVPVLLVGYGLLYEQSADLTPIGADPWVRLGAYMLGGAGLYVSRRAPYVMVILALACWGVAGSALFVIAASYLLARQQPRWWGAYLLVILLVHPIGLVPDPQVFAAGHALLPREAVPVYASVVPALVGFGFAMMQRVGDLKQAAFDAEIKAAYAHTRTVVALERLRLSREMHDILGQRLSLMVLHATAAATMTNVADSQKLLSRIAEEGKETIGDLHYIIGLLRHPDGPEIFVPPPTIAKSMEMARLEHITVVDDVAGTVLRRLSPIAGHLAAAVTREAMHNIMKYAPRSTATVSLVAQDGSYVLRIENTSPQQAIVDQVRGGFGLAELSEQADQVGGSLVAYATPTAGFAVELKVPA